jgi:hypothetical protein
VSISRLAVRSAERGIRPAAGRGAAVNTYVIFFNQQWVGDHPAEWFGTRGPLARAVVEEMRQAGVLVHAGGLDEDLGKAFSADATSGEIVFTDGPYVTTEQYLGGLTIVRVADEADARMWAGKLAVACGWPQEVRPIT